MLEWEELDRQYKEKQKKEERALEEEFKTHLMNEFVKAEKL